MRFKYYPVSQIIEDKCTGKRYYGNQAVTDLLNELHEENQKLIKMLDNVANYMQKQHKDMSIDDFVEWWNNIATEGL